MEQASTNVATGNKQYERPIITLCCRLFSLRQIRISSIENKLLVAMFELQPSYTMDYTY
ncbi:hypothetical protein FHS14_002072 [Paenibacillus baekrokdamisoli]|uniref:hypothetical protein n=1 Tax=Paenibacillus baekrokdamisoli TaxID=1712516 RepID=UPI00184AD1CA|nr:hypothetical protein [Paenibacillus baekrokdamisoli]MBB3069085.1 hypothetical protein [Paenibacillus baekrokdamisoli]